MPKKGQLWRDTGLQGNWHQQSPFHKGIIRQICARLYPNSKRLFCCNTCSQTTWLLFQMPFPSIKNKYPLPHAYHKSPQKSASCKPPALHWILIVMQAHFWSSACQRRKFRQSPRGEGLGEASRETAMRFSGLRSISLLSCLVNGIWNASDKGEGRNKIINSVCYLRF